MKIAISRQRTASRSHRRRMTREALEIVNNHVGRPSAHVGMFIGSIIGTPSLMQGDKHVVDQAPQRIAFLGLSHSKVKPLWD